MQPYFFPYAGHFSLVAACDVWVVFDICQYTPRTWMNRNRVLHPAGGTQYVTVPLSNGSIHIQTRQATLVSSRAARLSVLGKLSHYRRYAPFYPEVIGLVEQAFAGEPQCLVQLNLAALAAVCRYLGLSFKARLASSLRLALPQFPGPGDWAPAICASLGASDYVNPIGGAPLFDPATFRQRGVALAYLDPPPLCYRTPGFGAVPNLSILDVLMWNEPGAVAAYLQDTGNPTRLIPHGEAPAYRSSVAARVA